MRDEIGDAELLQAIGNADTSAFAVLTRRYARRCYSLAYRLLGNREMAEDTVQEVFLKIWTKPFMWQPDRGAKFSTWLYRVVSNAAVDTYRRFRSASSPRSVSFDELSVEPAQEGDGVKDAHIRIICEHLRTEINNLPINQRLAIIYCRMEGMSYIEAGEVMGVTAKSVDGYINRGVRALRQRMKSANLDIEEVLK